MKLLLIEDEKALAVSIVTYFQRENFICEWAPDYETAVEKISIYRYDCVLVDIMLPDGSGLDVIRALKRKYPDTGIITISAKNSLDDKIVGLNLGADDYLTKPFHLSELNARVQAVIRRRSFQGNQNIVFGEIKIDPAQHLVQVSGHEVVLTRKEYDLLIYLISNKNRVLTKESIAEHLWGDDADLMDNFDFIYTHIKNLRKKLMDKGCPDYLKSMYGVGYKFSEK
ncbi:response regulator transcription factor [Dyadobacter luticola]|uniref:Response regulator transcription factor n=1 Tax=Dyadobacter luticola TaxID=1979387 RepID=A0A5R9L5I5_9BACT|nr:response regulator transcription factor [Dyadobacter luticola]TLV03826.1 response regulator transcription factor [Dyadobacter luticola]